LVLKQQKYQEIKNVVDMVLFVFVKFFLTQSEEEKVLILILMLKIVEQ